MPFITRSLYSLFFVTNIEEKNAGVTGGTLGCESVSEYKGIREKYDYKAAPLKIIIPVGDVVHRDIPRSHAPIYNVVMWELLLLFLMISFLRQTGEQLFWKMHWYHLWYKYCYFCLFRYEKHKYYKHEWEWGRNRNWKRCNTSRHAFLFSFPLLLVDHNQNIFGPLRN